MHELTANEFARCIPSLRHLRAGAEIAGSVVAGQTTGRILMSADSPRASLMAFVNGFAVIGGPVASRSFVSSCVEWCRLHSSDFLILYPGDSNWARILDEEHSTELKKHGRVALKLNPNAFEKRQMTHRAECEIVALDASRMCELAQSAYPWMGNTWRSLHHFERYGSGSCAVIDGKVACVCYSVFVSGTHHEIDIFTVAQHRRRGLAQAAASDFIRRAISAGREPGWNCFESNTASYLLANSLGFRAVKRFEVFTR